MPIPQNVFCWHGISTDVERGTPFYSGVLGWTVDETDEGAMFIAPGGAVAHIQPVLQGRPAWCSYLSVDDLDGSTVRATEHGGTMLVPPTPLAVGRFSVVAAPSGAVLGLYEPTETNDLSAPGPGSVHWVELQSTAVDADLCWLNEVFSLSYRTRQMAEGPYHVLEADGAPRGGVRTTQAPVSAFVAWVEVADLDATLQAVTTHGGEAVAGVFSDPAVGRMAVVGDPAGAVFGLVQPS